MVATAIIAIGIMGFFGAFRYIMISLHVSRSNTMATNLAQQQVEILKNVPYYSLLLTTAPVTIPGTSKLYDPNNYPPQTFNINGMLFNVYTYVAMVQVQNNIIGAVSLNYPDTGLKQINVNVVWTDRGTQRLFSLSNLLENPNVAALDSGFSGTVSAIGGGTLAGAIVRTQENPNWSAFADSSGKFSFAVVHGSYTIEASSAGYYNAVAAAASAAGTFTTGIALSLQATSSGSIAGEAWYNEGLVVSQVVGTTHTCTGASCTGANIDDVEYLELFNPTTHQINIASAAGNPVSVTEYIKINTTVGGLTYNDIMNAGGVNYVYVSSYVAAGGYFLLANHPTFMANGIWVTADAYFGGLNCGGGSPTNCIANHSYGGVQVQDNLGNIIDRVCWSGGGGSPPAVWCNGSVIPTDSVCGMNAGEPVGSCGGSPYEGNQLVRFSSPTVLGRTMTAGTYGSAYNSKNNAADFIYPVAGTPSTYGLQYNPFTTSSPVLPIISGVPAVGAVVAARDLFSGSVQAVSASVADAAPWSQLQLYAPFTLPGVTTGTWSIDIATVNGGAVPFYGRVDNVAVIQGAGTAVPNAGTTPPWTVANVYGVMLTSTSAGGFVKGQVTDVLNNPISGIQVVAGGVSKIVGANGSYFAAVATGTIAVTANPNNANPNYVQAGVQIAVNSGGMAIQNFALSKGGMITGYIATGSSPLPQIVAVALNAAGNQAGSGTTDASGHFYIGNISSGTYTVQPVLGAGQTTSPVSVANVSIAGGGAAVFSASFTVTGALATLSGTVTQGGAAVATGALIIVSTAAIGAPPATIQGSNANTLTPVYAVSSLADGTYSLSVAATNTPYNVLVSLPVVAPNGTVSMHTNTFTVSVPTPNSTVTQALTVP